MARIRTKKDYFLDKLNDLPRRVFINIQNIEKTVITNNGLYIYDFTISTSYIREISNIIDRSKRSIYKSRNIDLTISNIMREIEIATSKFALKLIEHNINCKACLKYELRNIFSKINGTRNSSLRFKEITI